MSDRVCGENPTIRSPTGIKKASSKQEVLSTISHSDQYHRAELYFHCNSTAPDFGERVRLKRCYKQHMFPRSGNIHRLLPSGSEAV